MRILRTVEEGLWGGMVCRMCALRLLDVGKVPVIGPAILGYRTSALCHKPTLAPPKGLRGKISVL